jgi:hypothetical protein
MNQLTGEVVGLTPVSGIFRSIDIQLKIGDPDDKELVTFVWMSARVSVSFVPNSRDVSMRREAHDIGIAVPRFSLPQFRKETTMNFTLPVDERLISNLEDTRKGMDVVVYLSVQFNAIVKNLDHLASGDTTLGGYISDPRYGQEIVDIVPRSQWEEIIQGLHISGTESIQMIAEYEAKGKQLLDNINSTLATAKEAAKSVGIVEHAQFFEEEAKNHKRSAHWWLGFTILFAVAASTAAGFNFLKVQQLVSNTAAAKVNATNIDKSDGFIGLEIQLTVAKLIILSILLSISIWAGKVYKAHRHNFVINRHRRNALSTFQTFATGASDPQIKDAVLLQATTCIFGPQNTGYISQEKEYDGYPQILEIIRGVGGPAKK